MIKVLNIISDTNIGGAGKVLLNYLTYRDASKFDVSVALPRGSALIPGIRERGVQVYELDVEPDRSMSLPAIKELKRLIREVKPDIVHTHGFLSARIAARQCGCAVIFTRHSAFPVKPYMKKGPGRRLNKLVNEHYADRIIAISPATAENLTDGGVDPKLIDVMMNGVEPVERKSPGECEKLRKELGIAPEDFVLGIMARLEDYKGHADILEALKTVTLRRPNVKLLVAGAGPFEQAIRDQTARLGLEKNVVMMGFVADVSGVLSLLDLQLNASWGTETSSLSLLEGFSMGVPAVASDYGGNPWTVDDGADGLIFKTRDVKDLADKILLLMDNPSELERMGAEAKRIYAQRFTGQAMARRIEEVYTKTLETRHGKG